MAVVDIRTGNTLTRRDFGKGLATILAAGSAPWLAASANASVPRGMMRNVGARNAVMFGGGTASTYRNVKCLTSNGAQTIDTLFRFGYGAIDAYSKVKFSSAEARGLHILFGQCGGQSIGNYGVFCGCFYSGIRAGYGRSYAEIASYLEEINTLEITRTNSAIIVNINGHENTLSSDTNKGKVVSLFSAMTSSAFGFASCSIYDAVFSMQSGGIHLIPVVRNADEKPGMLNEETGDFLVNLGTGADFGWTEMDGTVRPPV